jgi:hypothetical protein
MESAEELQLRLNKVARDYMRGTITLEEFSSLSRKYRVYRRTNPAGSTAATSAVSVAPADRGAP